jgi:predicted acylesterase/phospholipase RssA
LWRWRRDRFRPWRVKDDESSAIATFRSDQDVIDRLWKEGRVYLQHLFVIAPELEQIPPDFEVQRYFHRILYVTTQTPSRVPAVLRRLLRPEVLARGMRNSHDVVPARLADLLDPDWRPPATFPDDAGPYFCSFIATRIRAGMSAARFDSQPADEEANIAQRERDAWPGWRIARDECRVPFHIDRLQSQWERWVKRGRRGAFADVAHRDDIQHAARWARAVTNRQVGVALSGGGASGYRLLPALKRFAQQGVPVDVVSGVSGGALIAAYYCAGGLPGLDRCIRTGRILQWILLPAAFSSDVFRWVVDRDLSAARIENLPVRLVAVATGLPDKGPPQGHVITRGTVGEAVQASGSAPLGFGPTDKATGSGPVRYTDGAFASMVPARILKDFGADYVFAFNCLAGPGKRNPLERYPLGQALYAYTPVGRLVDLWVSMAYLIEAASREAAEDAHVYYDPHDAEVPLVESFGFANAREIVRQAAACPRLRERVDACVAFWREVKERATEIPAPSSLGDPG